MTNKEIALKIIHRNEDIIRDRLFTDGYLFDDELIDAFLTSPVARELSSCIEEYFELKNELYVIRQEMNGYECLDGVMYFSGCEIGLLEIIKIAKLHYNIR